VAEYSYEQSVVDGVNVGYDVYLIEADITQKGAELKAQEWVDHRDRQTRKKRWLETDEDTPYTGKELDRSVVNPSQIRQVIQAMKTAVETQILLMLRRPRRPLHDPSPRRQCVEPISSRRETRASHHNAQARVSRFCRLVTRPNRAPPAPCQPKSADQADWQWRRCRQSRMYRCPAPPPPGSAPPL
jgi:hypothetical protein